MRLEGSDRSLPLRIVDKERRLTSEELFVEDDEFDPKEGEGRMCHEVRGRRREGGRGGIGRWGREEGEGRETSARGICLV